MRPASITESLWLGRDDRISAEDRLRSVVASLMRARRVQQMVDYACMGLLAGLVLATLAILAARLVPLPISLWQAAAVPVIAALAVALWAAWQRHPDPLEVAIRVDLRLGLRQRLSTAWEFMTAHRDDERVGRLAVQAVKANLPRSPRRVFPLRINRWGQLAPLAAAALLLASVLDLEWTPAVAPSFDERVASEGQRLSVYARAMHERARRDALPRSAKEAERLERLGRRMQGGAYSRAESLDHLRDMARSLDNESRRALAEGNNARAGAPETPSAKPGAVGQPGSVGALPRAGSALREMDDDTRTAITRAAGEANGDRSEADDEVSRQMLENGSAADRAKTEYAELRRAGDQVRQAQENLGESLARRDDAGRLPSNTPGVDEGEDEDGWNASRHRGAAGTASRSAGRSDVPAPAEPDPTPLRSQSAQNGPLLKPQGQMREGESFVSQAQIAPRSARPSAEEVPLSREFASQVEEVMSRDDYPVHYKRFIRQYFLTLSQGEPKAEPPAKEPQ